MFSDFSLISDSISSRDNLFSNVIFTAVFERFYDQFRLSEQVSIISDLSSLGALIVGHLRFQFQLPNTLKSND